MLELKAIKRDIAGERAKKIRKGNKIPCVLYGHGVDSLPMAIDYKDFVKVYNEAGENIVISLNVQGETYNVLVKDVQSDPVKDSYLHVDFYQINVNEKTTAFIPFNFIGEVEMVKTGQAILIKGMDEVEVEGLPLELPHEITVDLSVLKTLNDSIQIKDLQIAANIEILAEPEETIASLSEPRAEEEAPVTVETEGQVEGAKEDKSKEGAADNAEKPKEEKKTEKKTDKK